MKKVTRTDLVRSLNDMRDKIFIDVKDYYTSRESDKALLSIDRNTQKFVNDIVLPLFEELKR
jgi:hypothetical protein